MSSRYASFSTWVRVRAHRRRPFHAKRGTPTVNGLYSKITKKGPVGPLLTNNPNTYNPTRLTHSQALTCDQDHAYTAEQQAVNGGKMDKFVQFTNTPTCTGTPTTPYGAPGLVMNYFDGNTVTGLWNYAQHYAMSDNNYDTTFGPSTPGALNLISGNDGSSFAVSPSTGAVEPDPGTVSALNSSSLGLHPARVRRRVPAVARIGRDAAQVSSAGARSDLAGVWPRRRA